MVGVARIICALFVLLSLAACSGAGLDSIAPAGGGADDGASLNTDYYTHLAGEYRAMAAFENGVAKNTPRARYFNDKADQAAWRKALAPERPELRRVPAPALEEMHTAYTALTDALADPQANGALKAMAQTRYDCWLTAIEDDPSGVRARVCRGTFNDAMALLDKSGDDADKIFSVYFGSGDAAIDPENMETVRRVAAVFERREGWTVVLTGHADSKSERKQSEILSARRALAVKNALAQQGVPLENLAVESVGDREVRPDAVDTARDRRVDLQVVPAGQVAQRQGAHIKDLLPNNFGSDRPVF